MLYATSIAASTAVNGVVDLASYAVVSTTTATNESSTSSYCIVRDTNTIIL